MVQREEEEVTNGVHHDGVNGVTKAKTLPKSFDPIEDCVEAFARGEMVVVLDSTDRENEGDLILSAQDCTTEKLAFMIRYTSGYICAPLGPGRSEQLELPPMVSQNADPNKTAYTVTVDAITPELTTGISARDRAATARMLANPDARPEDFRRPGHLVPLQSREGGVRARFGHTEAAVELCRLAGKEPAAVICEMVLDGEEVPGKAERVGGRMMRRDDCLEFGRRWGLMVCTIEDMTAYVEGREGKLEVEGSDY
ncbi:3,4-dihydroxy-2-butanone 4-phosphate synthase in complex with zinc ions [Tothia fuscella]|uniref:3,4-dihydroxy-2-butanone 4-phosphate synthase n=1 Tax=Tothia fuscella TaxID=1048955 RepID=A0A9P4NIN4_9PEZI|nr:3,4-dihydroxy-2-butanone 4-phosphate synthase in complex with zinc ions [Tothia fuscella]